jgi:hypothetical protein
MNPNRLRTFQYAILMLLGTNLIGCASVTMPPPTASASTVEKLRTANLVPSMVGNFTLAPDRDPDMDRKVGGLRGSSIHAASGSYSQQLKDVIITELKAAGLYDEKSQIQIEGQLTDSQVDAAIGTGTARLAAHFTVNRAGKRVFDKELSVDAQWESSFVGAIALPAAINQYTSLYKSLAAKLFDDQDFRTALAH